MSQGRAFTQHAKIEDDNLAVSQPTEEKTQTVPENVSDDEDDFSGHVLAPRPEYGGTTWSETDRSFEDIRRPPAKKNRRMCKVITSYSPYI